MIRKWTQVQSKKLFDYLHYIKYFTKNLCFVGSSTLCYKSEGIWINMHYSTYWQNHFWRIVSSGLKLNNRFNKLLYNLLNISIERFHSTNKVVIHITIATTLIKWPPMNIYFVLTVRNGLLTLIMLLQIPNDISKEIFERHCAISPFGQGSGYKWLIFFSQKDRKMTHHQLTYRSFQWEYKCEGQISETENCICFVAP